MAGVNREALGRELAGVLRRIARERAELAAESKVRRGRISELERRADEIVAVIEERAGVQLPIPAAVEAAAVLAEAKGRAK